MKKQTLNRRVRIAGALLLAALLLSAVVAPLALLASPSTGISGEGALSFASAEEPDVTPVPDHDQDSLDEQSKILAGADRNDRGCGFEVEITDGGLSVSGAYPSGGNDKINENLIENGILHYAKYENSLCKYLNNLIIILDFSDFFITEFTAQAFNFMYYAILGGAYEFPSYTVENIPVYDSATGKKSRETDATFTDGTTITVDGQTITDGGISLRIVLPNLGEDKTLVFDDYSLHFYDWGNMGSLAPECVSIDISNLTITPKLTEDGKLDTGAADTFSGLKISTKATQPDFLSTPQCSHIHFIGRTGNQLEYALDTSVEFTKANTDTETEIFIRQPSTDESDPESKFIFTRMYSRVYQAGSKTNIDIIDSAVFKTQPTEADLVALLETGHWLHFRLGESIETINSDYVLYHQRRSGDNSLFEEKVLLTIDAAPIDISGVTVYKMSCEHSDDEGEKGSFVGYFGAGRKYFKDDYTPFDDADKIFK